MNTLTLTAAEVNVVLNALGELPAKHTFGLILKIQSQMQTQVPPPGPPAPGPAAEPTDPA